MSVPYKNAFQLKDRCTEKFHTYADSGILYYHHAIPDHLQIQTYDKKDYNKIRQFYRTLGDIVSYKENSQPQTAVKLINPISYSSNIHRKTYLLHYLKLAYAQNTGDLETHVNALAFTGNDFDPPLAIAIPNNPDFTLHYQTESLAKYFQATP
jgi:hypothetical protein